LHLDLRQRQNILCDADEQPGVLDFEAALVFDPTRAFGRLALHRGAKLDRLALLKHKARYAPRLLASREWRLVRAASVTRWVWPSTLLHRARVSLRRLRRAPPHGRGGS
jgi:aminoglycoside phosphotransferase (APT) family kinase protein